MNVMTREIQQQMSPEEALNRLLEGNQRFLDNTKKRNDLRAQVAGTASDQYPFAAILGCIDSRAPSELIFDQGIGDIFTARVAGNIVNEDILGSLEYACHVVGSKLILVLGHTSCGAVTAACNHVEMGNITALLSKITPALKVYRDTSDNVDEVARENVRLNVLRIRKESEILAQMEANGQIKIRGAMYDVATGEVSILE
jgi:carbonic anhydrase